MVKLQPEEHHFSHGKKHPKSIKVGNFNLLQISNKYISPEQIYYLNHIMRKLVLRNSSDQPVYHVIYSLQYLNFAYLVNIMQIYAFAVLRSRWCARVNRCPAEPGYAVPLQTV